MNDYRDEQGLEHFMESAVYGAILRMQPKTEAIKIISQGHSGDCEWTREQFKWILQLLIHLGEDPGVEIPSNDDGTLPEMFDIAKEVQEQRG